MNFLRSELDALTQHELRRALRQHDGCPGRLIEIDGQQVLNFSSNNYLGLANHPRLVEAACAGAREAAGSTASRLVTGNLAAHESLERELAEFHQLPAARLFNSGYQANVGLISAIAGQGDLIVSDALNHASLIDGCRLSRATVRVAKHGDVASFSSALEDGTSFRRRFVLSDGIFSMDGDAAPVAMLRQLCDETDSFLVVDEAHACGVLGPGGRGICAANGVVADALVGGLGKGFGSFGGYVAGSEDLCEFLLNRARSFVFSTALPPAVLESGRAALALLRSEAGDELRERLQARIEQFSEGLAAAGQLAKGAGSSAIFPIVAGEAATALDWSRRLLDMGIFCQAIRPPTVEQGTSRLRIALSALHTSADIDTLLGALQSL